jgi:hypothetical protein
MRLEVKTGAYSTFTWIVHSSTANNDSVRLSLCPKISNKSETVILTLPAATREAFKIHALIGGVGHCLKYRAGHRKRQDAYQNTLHFQTQFGA